MSPVTKIIGADFELGNALLTDGQVDGRPGEAAKLLLEQIQGYPLNRLLGGTSIEFGRRFLLGGGSAYIDMDHLEMNLPPHGRSVDHVLYVHAALRIARQAQLAAQAELPRGTKIVVTANNCDGTVSYGSHLRHTVSHQAFADLHQRKLHFGAIWATHLVTSVIYSGQGMVGAANGREPSLFQLAARPDFFSRLKAIETTHDRPIINLRDESHSKTVSAPHTIYLDRVLCPGACQLQAVTTQLVLAMIEANVIDTSMALDDPIEATSAVSRDLTLNVQLRTVKPGVHLSALEIQRLLCDQAAAFVASGACGNAVPGAAAGVAFWSDTLDRLEQRDFDALAGRCDNWLKYRLIGRALDRRGLSWRSPQAKLLDIHFGSLDPDDSLFFQAVANGTVENMPSDEQINRAITMPPDDTRAFLFAWMLRRYSSHISSLDWSYINFRLPKSGSWQTVARMELPDPRAFGRRHSFSILHDAHDSLTKLVDRVNADAEQIVRTGVIPFDEYQPTDDARPQHIQFD